MHRADVLSRLSKRTDVNLIAAFANAGVTHKTLLDSGEVAEKIQLISTNLNVSAEQFSTTPNEIHGGVTIRYVDENSGQNIIIDFETLFSAEYRDLLKSVDEMSSYGAGPLSFLLAGEK
ncbi:MAG TPA: hypothetical protein PKW56_09455, partial [Clostridiales bacterium]|nr:hypothetical protein [Clostridiales bacterium]